MKRILMILLAAALCAGMSACRPDNTEAPSPEESPVETEQTQQSDPVDLSLMADTYSYSDDVISMTLGVESVSYSLQDFIEIPVEVTNNGGEAVIFTYGSGSNVVPSDLKVDLNGFAPLHYPQVMTMDFQVATLKPGETLQYTYKFAPYISNEGIPAFGTDLELEFFQEGEFTPAEAGENPGTIYLNYLLESDFGDSEFLMPTEDMEMRTVGGGFSVTIAA